MEKKVTDSRDEDQHQPASSSSTRKDEQETTTNHQPDRDTPSCGTDVARARWTLLRQVLRQKQVVSSEVKQVSVRRFSTFNLFTRTTSRIPDPQTGTHPTGTHLPSEDQWVEYRSASYPEFSALLRDNLGPIRVDEVLTSFDNTGNVCKCISSMSYNV
ncbi:calmodulin-lysine N-methyltransferase [Hypomesus transpacificus]|uniref:calmodulin-lysine N-methyltransferase n=1 Tax=Hypomesus transpacificus TaxID=137520 RepID=UPI001F084A7E|nr:calmodulin-lysine N-methyltransferase [Hypomesus transpacificus]